MTRAAHLWRAVGLTAALLVIAGPLAAQAQDPLVRFTLGAVENLPPSDVKRVLERMPADDRDAVLKRAEKDLERLRLAALSGALSAAAEQRSTVDVLTVHTARELADRQPSFIGRVKARASVSGKVLEPISGATPGSSLRTFSIIKPDLVDRATTLLSLSQYIYKPKRPKNEGEVAPTNRLAELVVRGGFRSVVGIGRRVEGNGIGVYCSGVLISPTAVLTAAHCLEGPDAPPQANQILVLTEFTGGTEPVVRLSDDKPFKGVQVHAVTGGKPHGGLDSSHPEIWKNDVAVLILTTPIPDLPFARRANAAPNPLVLTAAGWGRTDAEPVNGIALEVTTVRLKTGVSALVSPPSLLSWKASAASGAGVCRGDSGGPLFAGDQDGSQPGALQLVGLVASGNDCRSGDQYVTDLTVEATRAFVCSQALDAAYCS